MSISRFIAIPLLSLASAAFSIALAAIEVAEAPNGATSKPPLSTPAA